jgi:hypothetical protein
MYLDFLFSQLSVLQTHSCKISYIKKNYTKTSILLILTSKFHIGKKILVLAIKIPSLNFFGQKDGLKLY